MPRTIKSPEARAHATEYEKNNFSVVSAHIPKSTADQFRKLCKLNGTTVHAELKKFIESEIKKAED